MDRKIKKACVITLGCKTNSVESMAIKEQLESCGVEIVPLSRTADLFIINSCTVTQKTDAETCRIARRAKRTNPKSIVVITGCLAQLKADELIKTKEIDHVFDNTFKHDIVNYLLNLKNTVNDIPEVLKSDIFAEKKFVDLAPANLKGRNRAFLKIEDGCDAFCTYCIVPYARGSVRSLPPKEVVAATNRFVAAGFKEVVLTGIHIGKYGIDLSPASCLPDLLREIEKSTDLTRLRLSSIEPNEITDEFIDLMSSSKTICNHLHIPLQSGDDEILKAMKRPYSTEQFAKIVKALKESVKDLLIGADVIAGFPGETDERFDNTFKFIEEGEIDYLHVFPYSKREGTKAYDMDGHIPADLMKERARLLRELGERKRASAYQSMVGKRVRVLFEKKVKKEAGMLHGLTRNYLNAVTKDFSEDMFNSEIEFKVNKIDLDNNHPIISL